MADLNGFASAAGPSQNSTERGAMGGHFRIQMVSNWGAGVLKHRVRRGLGGPLGPKGVSESDFRAF